MLNTAQLINQPMDKRGIYCGNVSVRPSVCLRRCGIVPKRLNLSSKFFHRMTAQHSGFLRLIGDMVLEKDARNFFEIIPY